MRREPGADRVLRLMETPEIEEALGLAADGDEADMIRMLEALAQKLR